LKKDILTLIDLDKSDFDQLFNLAIDLKKSYTQGKINKSLEGKTLGLIFDKASTRTRISFETAMVQLGGTPIFISTRDTQIARNEPVRDTARVLSGYLDGLAIRTYSQDLLIE
jgi:ornithine carbamoyltransferase